MKVYIINQAYDTHNCGGDNWTEKKCYLNREDALNRFNTIKQEIREQFMKDYHPDADEFTEDSSDAYYEIERMDYYDWSSVSIEELDTDAELG